MRSVCPVCRKKVGCTRQRIGYTALFSATLPPGTVVYALRVHRVNRSDVEPCVGSGTRVENVSPDQRELRELNKRRATFNAIQFDADNAEEG